GRAWVAAVLAVAGFLLFSAATALAGVGLCVSPSWATASVKAGQMNVPASIQIKWLNTTPNDTHANNVTAIELTPSCGAFVASSICPLASADPGVITLSSSGTGVGCGAVTTFTITVVDAPTGRVSFTPGFQLP